MTIILVCVVSLSLLSNAFLIYKLKTVKRLMQSDFESELLADLLRGNALVRIERIAPESVFLRRT
jgi:hypothetical protein